MKYALIPYGNSVMRRVGIVLLLASMVPFSAHAGPREQAKRIHDRIAGVPPSASVLADMEADIAGGNAIDAALTATLDSAFYNVTLKNMVTPWTNIDQTVFAPLNDYTSTVIGMVRDDMDFREVLSADILYVGAANLGLTPYSNNNNSHYEQLESQGIDLKANLIQTTQSSVTGLNSTATAGVMTTRAAANAFFYAGTNRANFRFTLMNYLCLDLEQVKDITRVPDRIRKDVSRSPGGDSRIFLNNCIGCHSGMDPMAQAFAYFDWDGEEDAPIGQIRYNDVGMLDPDTGTRVQKKYHINENNFPYGYETPDDHWDNYWREGQNASLGWSDLLPGSGDGPKSMGQELAYSEQFSRCQVEKVFTNVCLRGPNSDADRAQVASMVTSFQSNSYSLRHVFAESAVFCMGE